MYDLQLLPTTVLAGLPTSSSPPIPGSIHPAFVKNSFYRIRARKWTKNALKNGAQKRSKSCRSPLKQRTKRRCFLSKKRSRRPSTYRNPTFHVTVTCTSPPPSYRHHHGIVDRPTFVKKAQKLPLKWRSQTAPEPPKASKSGPPEAAP